MPTSSVSLDDTHTVIRGLCGVAEKAFDGRHSADADDALDGYGKGGVVRENASASRRRLPRLVWFASAPARPHGF
jgi:hypothetical protein